MANTDGAVKEAPAKAQYTLKGVKTFRGMDGLGLNATLCRDGKPVAFILDEGRGGEVDFDWKDAKQGNSAEEELFKAFIEEERAKIPADKKDEFGPVRQAFGAEYWVNSLVDEIENTKRMKRICKSKTLFQVDAEIGGPEFRTIKGVGPKIRDFIASKYAGKKVRILNDELGL